MHPFVGVWPAGASCKHQQCRPPAGRGRPISPQVVLQASWCPRSHALRQQELCLHHHRRCARTRRKYALWAKPPSQALDAATSTLRQQVLDSKAGLPKVKQRLLFNELLRDIRLNKIARVEYIDNAQYSDNWYKDPTTWNLIDGSCLVIYHDGHVAYSCVPPSDIRLGLAMETHGVSAVRMTPAMPSGMLSKLQTPQIPSQYLVAFFTALPVAALVITYLATQLQAHLKGDREDRIKMRAQAQKARRDARMQAQADKLAMLPREMAQMGLSEDAICQELDKLKMPYQRAYILRVIAEEKEGVRPRGADTGDKIAEEPDASPAPEEFNVNEAEQRAAVEAAKQAEAMKTGDEAQDAAADLLKMRSARIIKAPTLDPEEEEMRAKTRAAMRRMKGVKLQISDERITFDDVAGIGEAKVELVEVVDFFARPELFRRSGARVPRGVLLCGPPGTGKTLLARAVAGEARVTFLSLNASEFVEMFAGVGAARVRDLFAQARSMAPAIIFIDEIDAVGRVRGGEMGNDERDQTLNQMLTEMDGFSGRDSKADVIVMAATNRKDVLDPALIRPGRFDRIITVPVPDVDGRAEILDVHLGYRPHDQEDVDVRARAIAFETQGFSGAQLGSLVNTAASLAGKAGREFLVQRDLQEALEDERLGPRKPGVQSYERRKRLAVQEAATALACTLMPSIEPVELVTIVPREKFPLGQTVVRVNEEREATKQFTRRYLEEQIITVLAGRAAEQIIYGVEEMSTLNQRRIATARELATRMVVTSAMGDSTMLRARTMSVPIPQGGGSVEQVIPPRVTSETQVPADDEMHVLLNGAYRETLQLLTCNKKALDALIEALLKDSGPAETGADSVEEFSEPYEDGTASTVKPYEGGTLTGEDVIRIVRELGDQDYLGLHDSEQAENDFL